MLHWNVLVLAAPFSWRPRAAGTSHRRPRSVVDQLEPAVHPADPSRGGGDGSCSASAAEPPAAPEDR